jgi:NAD(P)-dependent dehydrogenase (short-subunit alcohol dehydrogenase family)
VRAESARRCAGASPRNARAAWSSRIANLAGAELVAKDIDGLAVQTDVARESDVKRLVETRGSRASGRSICSAQTRGFAIDGGFEVPDSEWRRIIDINFMAHVYAGARGRPEQCSSAGRATCWRTASAAGLMTQNRLRRAYAVTEAHGGRVRGVAVGHPR